jgi:hypothetical protein
VAVDESHDLALIRVESVNSPSAFLPISPRKPISGESLWTATKAGVGQAHFKGKFVDPDVDEAFQLVATLGPRAIATPSSG